MKNVRKMAVLITAAVLSQTAYQEVNAQNWSITCNANIAAGTNYLGTSDPNDLVFRTNALERGRLLGSGGTWRFGSSTNNATFDSLGRLRFAGTGAYRVGGNRYAFQFDGDPDYGLFFNQTLVQYEFRDGSALPVFLVNANTGAGVFNSTLRVGAYTLPATDGTNNQVLKTNGAGVLNWSNDNNTTYSAGTGLSLAGTVFNNTAPDQVVAINGNNGISVSGTYPNFNVNGSNLWRTTGNAGTAPGINFIGTTDATDFVLRSNNLERMRILSNGDIGIGNNAPAARLHVMGGGEASLASGGNILSGQSTSQNIVMDNDEIQARNNGAAATLNLNPSGGTVITGGTFTAGGNVTVTGNIDVSGTVGFGSVETFSDGGSFTIASNSDIVPTDDDLFSLGNSTFRWSEVWAADGTINTSDARDKNNIRDLNYGLKDIMQLRSVKFNWKNGLSKEDKIGLIAQEIKKVIPEVVRDYEYQADEATGKKQKVPSARLGVMYADLIPVLIKAIQELQMEIEALKKGQVFSGTAIETNTALNNETAVYVNLSNATLEQNKPNPLKNTTSIKYSIPLTVKKASIIFYDMSGKAVKQVAVNPGKGTVNIDAAQMHSGTYSYSLVIDNKTVDSKKMVIAK